MVHRITHVLPPCRRCCGTAARRPAGVRAPHARGACGHPAMPSSTATAPRSRPHAASRKTRGLRWRSEEHTSELQSLMRISYAVFCLKKKKNKKHVLGKNTLSKQITNQIICISNTRNNKPIKHIAVL